MESRPADLPEERAGEPRHLVQFYESDGFLVRVAADFLEAGLRAGGGAVAIATPPHREALLQALASRKIDVQGARLAGTLALHDAEEVLQEVMDGDLPDPARFQSLVGTALRRASACAGRDGRAFGEMVDLLWRSGRAPAALRLEELWNDLARTHRFSVLCAYRMISYHPPEGLAAARAQHGGALPAEHGAPDARQSDREPARELAEEITQRLKVEDALRSTVAELRRAEAAARRNEEELRDHVERSPIGLQQVDVEGTVIWANQAQLDMLGYRRDEYLGQRMTRFHAGER